jgi:glycolate oxidase
VLIVELEGPIEVVAADRARLDEVLAAGRPVEVRPARDAAERLAIWKGRKSAFSAVGRLFAGFHRAGWRRAAAAFGRGFAQNQ